MTGRAKTTLAGSAVIVLAALLFLAPLLACPSTCAVDLYGWLALDPQTIELSSSDVRLNTWILAWVQHALLTEPAHLFDANIFYPSERMLAGSEHMLATAVLLAPLRAITTDAVALYNTALLVSFLVTGLSTFALVRWTTAHTFIAAAAGVLAMFMPWRLTELAHLQLLFAGWLPLLWMLAAGCLEDDVRPRRLLALLLVSTVIMFSSYYLAYFSLFASTAFVLAAAAVARPHPRRVLATLATLAAPALVLAAFSLPYLARSAGAEIIAGDNVMQSTPLAMLRQALAPSHPAARPSLPWNAGYSLPAMVTLMAAFALFPVGMDSRESRIGAGAAARLRVRSVVAGMLAVSVIALTMALGERVQLGSIEIRLPAAWADALIPGFGILRAPLRWTLLLGVAWPVLAGIGLAKLYTLVSERLSQRAAGAMVAMMIAAAVPAVFPPALPTAATYPDASAGKLAAYDALAKLPAGPVLELPWPRLAIANASTSSEYMVASTRHWQPLLNGYTGYKPRSYDFLVRAGARLPDRTAVERMSRTTGVRWIVAHLDRMEGWERVRWENAATHGPLASAYRDERTAIYEVVAGDDAGSLAERVRADAVFPDTIAGVSRAPLELSPGDGALAAVFPPAVNRYTDGWASQSVPLRIVNHTKAAWPGIDPDPAGLVHVRYRLSDASGGVSAEGVHALDDDVAAGATLVENVLVQGRLDKGEYRLCLDLVQLVDGAWRTLAISPVCGEATVVPVAGTAAS